MNNTRFNQNGRVSALVIAVMFIAGTMAIGCKEERPALSVGDTAPEFEAKQLARIIHKKGSFPNQVIVLY